MSRLRARFSSDKVLIGVIHLPPLPGYRESPGIDEVVRKALRDQEALESGGVDGILVENEEDRPHRVDASRETIAAMTRVASELSEAKRNALVGVEILLNDPEASLAVAQAAGAAFIRTDYFVDPMERPEHGGAMRIDPEGLMAFRSALGAEEILVLADIQVKYARMLVSRSLGDSATLARKRGADAIVVTGTVTGESPRRSDVEEAKRGAGALPVLVGSGLDAANARELLTVADGAIVGTSLKSGRDVDRVKVRALVDEVRRR